MTPAPEHGAVIVGTERGTGRLSVEDEVRTAVAARADALATGDRAALERLMHPACVWTTHAGLVLGRDEYVERNTSVVTWRAQRVDVERVTSVGDTAVAIGTVADTVHEDGGDVDYRMRITLVWVQDPYWQLLAAHAGPHL